MEELWVCRLCGHISRIQFPKCPNCRRGDLDPATSKEIYASRAAEDVGGDLRVGLIILAMLVITIAVIFVVFFVFIIP